MPFSSAVICKCRQNHVSNSHLNRMLIFPTTCAGLLVVLFHEPAKHEDRIRTCCTQVFLYTHLMRHDKERYYFNSPIRAQAGITAILSRNFRRKFPYFERKSGYQMPVYNTGLFPKKENIRIFHESWIFLPFINIDTLFLMYILCRTISVIEYKFELI